MPAPLQAPARRPAPRSLAHLDHTAVSCPSKGGKSFFLRAICEQFMRAGNDVLVCDPLGYKWPATWVTRDEYAFLDRAKNSRCCALLMDELGMTALERDFDNFKWLLTTSRHNHHVFIGAMQDFTQMPLRMRKQLTQLYLFKCHPKEAAEWAFQFHQARDFILNAPNLQQYEFMRLRSFSAPQGPLRLPAP